MAASSTVGARGQILVRGWLPRYGERRRAVPRLSRGGVSGGGSPLARGKFTQLLRDQTRVLRPRAAILGQHAGQDPLKLRRHAHHQGRERRGFTRQVRKQEL